MKKYDEYGIEQGTLNLTPYIVLGIVLFLVLISIVILIFNIGNITKHISQNEKNKEHEKTKEEIKIEEVEGLVVPKIENGKIFKDRDFNIELSKIDTSSKGYTLYIDITANQNINPSQIECYRILIDGYDIPGNFKMNINPGETKQEKIVLKKTDLEHLQINNFQNLEFYMTIIGGAEDVYVYGKTNMQTLIPVDNEKKGLTNIYDKNSIILSYYKKVEDNDYTYLYFEVKNLSQEKYNIYLNKIVIDNKLYEDEYSIHSEPYGKQMSYIKIPKDKVENVGKIKISFFLEKETTMDKYQIHISVEKEINT
ncbi:MAG: hypothetical protein IJZ46_00535 [Bacilli bacterium]|nr:hypothetical protein [Bacilli bacterium]